ncbi:hypothetical protein Zm00014a_020484 [Zea mays]|uniref:Uncharacterized protein n=1 Tax=Zea mays TaxID=4577 RepID=A0A3L6F187_MAIZE|nr:hypothetical protein Zm00014a_020484 [Zea mays]
MCFTNRLAKQ